MYDERPTLETSGKSFFTVFSIHSKVSGSSGFRFKIRKHVWKTELGPNFGTYQTCFGTINVKFSSKHWKSCLTTKVVYRLLESSGNFGWNVNGKYFLGSSNCRLYNSPFFLSQPANDAGAREATGARCAAFSPVPHGCASHTSPLPRTRVVRWLGEKKGTALQSSPTGKFPKWTDHLKK